MVSERHRFVCSSCDTLNILRPDRYEQDDLPPGYFNGVMAAFLAWYKVYRVSVTPG